MNTKCRKFFERKLYFYTITCWLFSQAAVAERQILGSAVWTCTNIEVPLSVIEYPSFKMALII